jgi:NADPH:quinone reductase-like Zn-dependent oxidoreductase
MHAVVLEQFGGPERLSYRQTAEPEIGPDEVLVQVRATGVCGRDLIDARGGFPAMPLPAILGHEFAGEVLAVGNAVRDLSPGDRVVNLHRPYCGDCRNCLAGASVDCERAWQSFGHTVPGGYAERVAAHHRALFKFPAEIDFVEAAPVMCTAAVALRGLRHHARLMLGEQVLITGASGGVGVSAIQIARALGARVLAVTSSESKRERLKQLGADETIVSPNSDFHEAVRKASGGGVDVSLELTGSATFASALRSLRSRGRMVVIGNIDTGRVSVNLGAMILYSYALFGSHGAAHQDLTDCFELMQRGALRIIIDRQLPLKRAAEAHRLLGERAAFGRVVLVPGE